MSRPSGEAQYLCEHPLLNEILDGLERSAMERAVNARPSDDESRRVAMHDVRAVRHLRAELAKRALGSTTRPQIAAP